jgi:hypothetical protein
MKPKRIVIIRHAEKPNKNDDPRLAMQGEMRALGLTHVLPKEVNPDFIFASTSSVNSERPFETIHPTAKKLGLKVNTSYADKDCKKLAKRLFSKKKYADKTILICWHHGQMPKLIEALGFASPFKKWPETLFDRIIDLHIASSKGADSGLVNSPQRILFTDSIR